ncbi:MAG: undecaprenyl-diphosphate phosphatase [Anaerolineae bacterium]|nr:undecaprenyl-diphosphate phosphatase [Anaerolineae bacterium]
MSEWIKVILLGILEGVTEFLPISSTGHLIVAAQFMQLQDSLQGTFEIFIQVGAVVAVIVYYWGDLWTQVRDVPSNPNTRKLWLGVIVAFIPAAVLGLLAGDFLEQALFNPLVVAGALIVGGVMFLVIERFFTGQQENPVDSEISNDPLTLRQAIIVGFWQVLALVPGMSRSGMSIIGGMLAGLDRRRATQFSFYLAIPTLGAATVYSLLRDLSELNSNDLQFLFVGAVISGIVAWLSIGWLLRYVSRNNFIPFGYYRIILGIVILVITLM